MKKTMLKDFFREIWKTKSRFLSILAIVALGAGFFAGINVTTTDMKMTATNYYRNYRLMDYHLQCTYGITDDDINALEQQKDTLQIDTMMAGYSKDVIANPGTEQEAAVKVLSYGGDGQTLNQYKLLDGRMPEKANECVVDTSSKVPKNFAIGETITIGSGAADDPLEDTLAYDTYTVVGIVQTPLYVNYSRGHTTIGNGTLLAFLVVPEDAFVLDVYTDVYLTTVGASALDPFTDAYPDLIDERKSSLEAFAKNRGTARYDDIVAEAQQKLEDGKQELIDGKKKQQTELQKAQKKLEDAKAQLKNGQAELQAQKANFEEQKASGLQQLQAAEAKLNDNASQLQEKEQTLNSARAQYEKEYPSAIQTIQENEAQLASQKQAAEQEFIAAEQQLAAAKKQLDDAKSQIDQGQAELDSSKAQLDDAKAALSQKQQELEAAKGQLPAEQYAAALEQLRAQQQQLDSSDEALRSQQEMLKQKRSEYETGLAAYQANQQKYTEQRSAAEAQFQKAQQQLDSGRAELAQSKAQLDSAEDAIAQGKAALENGRAQLQSQWDNYDRQIASGQQQLDAAEQKLSDAAKEIEKGQASYDKNKIESDKKLADAEKKIDKNEQKLKELEAPEWYVWTRDDNVGYPDFSNDADRLRNVSTVLPVFFILIAVLVCLTTMTRMVEERRTQIGTLKALGYGKGAIMMKYVLYALLATILGCAIGLSVGFVLFPSVLFLAYSSVYNIPDAVMPFHWGMAALCTAVGIVCMVSATLFACYKELLSSPAALMRPKAPPAGKKILLERWTSLWKKIPFAMKLTLRNLLRYKKRAAMTIIGIGGCTALMLTGFGMQYAISSIVDRQYDTIMVYDGVVSMKDGLTKAEKQSVADDIREIDGVTDQSFAKMVNITVQHDTASLDNPILMVPDSTEHLEQYIHLHTRAEKTPIPLTDDGVVVSEKLARVCNIQIGDTIDIKLDQKTVSVPVTAISENYVGNYVFLSPTLFQKTFGTLDYNCILINTAGKEYQDSISTKLTENERILGSSFNSDGASNFRDIIQNLNSVVIVIIISAGALAFIVLYNLVNINVAERTRELATLKILGFRDHETSAYIYRENIICTVIGILLGLFGGIFLERFVVQTAEVDSAMFAPEIPLYCFLFAGILTFLFTLVVNVALHFKLKKLDMVESLKSVE
ncbi:MAG: ABC transporter permease [Oscillospiraceae bacterium]|nr:ABC transporter permease [Oscillospiraceae bacterium]